MNRAIQQFEVNIQSASQLGIIYSALEHKVTAVIKLEELLRAELVLAVSAVDCYIHDIVRIGMTNFFVAAGGESNAFINFPVSLGFVKKISAAPLLDRAALVEEEIRRFHGYKTFQNADSEGNARLIDRRTFTNKPKPVQS
jgi:hypothetical protein